MCSAEGLGLAPYGGEKGSGGPGRLLGPRGYQEGEQRPCIIVPAGMVGANRYKLKHKEF